MDHPIDPTSSSRTSPGAATPGDPGTGGAGDRGAPPRRGEGSALLPGPRRAAGALRRLDDVGSATAEYAIATLAACGFAGLLLAVLTSSQVRGLLLEIIQRALSVA